MKQDLKNVCLCLAALLTIAATPAWSPEPWLADLKQMRSAIDRNYPNLEWLTDEREVSLDRWFDRTADEIRRGHDDADARLAMNKLVERFNDGHLELHWPASNSPANMTSSFLTEARSFPKTAAEFCATKGYDASQVTTGTAASLPGYRPINSGGSFASGLIPSGDTTIGVIRMGVFAAQGYPATCERAVTLLRTAVDQPCDDACDDRVMTEVYALMTHDLMSSIDQIRKSGAMVLLIDLTRNGGGTEWAEAAARIISPVTLKSAPIGVIRSENWVNRWKALAAKLKQEAAKAPTADRAMLIDFAQQAEVIADHLMPCSNNSCARLGQSGFASGLLAESPAGRLNSKSWGPDVFSAAQFPYQDSVWKGPVLVLVDSETWSAAEQFTALMQDNHAAIIIGGRTGGAGCGHLYNNDPITLVHSRAQLEMPNCARFRRNGSNEVSGIVPDVSTGVRWNDGAAYAGRLTAAHLPEAITKARALKTANDRQHPAPTSTSINH